MYTSPLKSSCFSMEKQIIHLPGPSIWAKYSSQGIYKANKTYSCLSTEERYSHHCLPRRLSNPGLLHRRVKSLHSANREPSTVARFHNKLGQVHSEPYSVIDNVSQSPREKDPEHTRQMSKVPFQPHSNSSRSGKPHGDIGGGSPRHLAGPPSITGTCKYSS